MIHLPPLIYDLGIILVVGALVTLLFKKLRQPLVLGYLVAGFLVSQHFPYLPTIQDKANISTWAEIGVIFLLFGLGLEFSFKKLVKVGGSAGFTAVFEVIFMVGLGYLVGRLIGWNSIDSLFMGGVLSISSTTIIVRAFQELNMKGQRFVELVFGILIVEDIVAVLLLVLLPSLAMSEGLNMGSLMTVTLRMVFFILLWFVVGIFLLPVFLRKIRTLLEEETTLIVSIALCFMMVAISSLAGFSPALGAFVMGSLLAETPEGHHIEKLINPVKNLFAAVFFVSVGTMIDPQIIMDKPALILLLTLVTIFGKFLSTYLGALLTGQSRKTSMQSGMSLAQIGEFSFIIAALGTTLKVTSDFIYPLAVAVSAVTTFTTPYLIKASPWFTEAMDRILPDRLKKAMDNYKLSFERQGSRNVGSLLAEAYGMKIILNSVVIVALTFGFKKFAAQFLQKILPNFEHVNGVSLMLCMILSAPFFWGLVKGRPSKKMAQDLDVMARLRRLIPGITFVRVLLAIVLLAGLVAQFISLRFASGALIGAVLVMGVLSYRYGEKVYKLFEGEFLSNLSEKEREEISKRDEITHLALPWDASISVLEVAVDSTWAGRTLRDLKFKENYSVTIASVVRGTRRFFAPSGDFVLWPFDKIVCFGSEAELQDLNQKVEQERIQKWQEAETPKYRMGSFVVQDEATYLGKTIRESGIREAKKILVVCVERGKERILGPSAGTVLQAGDLVWFVSE
ncbi:cation:proton antiporter [Bdellovibrio sp. ZAP7]|uniref:cation:proton antiporter n=1 Tax=Bdellovibrio sp. ZAP7 TaxID=2231053 RepID=UPI001159297B|nr:cation:proton antiporter [Bdellovibrio sp. ZAP7]QDK45455.1 cation:proton antiporter [Bdellovibrio sp. ZAP7]